MVQLWLKEVLEAGGKLFLNPLLYFSIILALCIGFYRVKRERRELKTRIFDMYHELRFLFPMGIMLGLGFSLLTVGAGLVIPFGGLLVIGAVTVLLALTFQIRLLTPAFTVGIGYLVLLAIRYFKVDMPLFNTYFEQLNDGLLNAVVVLLGTLLLIEGVLINLNGGKKTSPRLIKSSRGLKVGAQEGKRLWIVPMFLLIPVGSLELPWGWWPVFTLGSNTYSLILFPFLIGYRQLVRSTLPQISIKETGNRVFWLGALVLTVAVAGYYAPYISIAGAAMAIAGREWISYIHRKQDSEKSYYFSRKSQGIMILAVLPGSPAEKMSLISGEMITKVNGFRVQTEEEFYEALQQNRAYCKLEVIDTNGQIRFAQGALYEGDHHELGIIFVEEDREWSSEVGYHFV
ncbi:PDZ domain-containing protein [Rossellomorea vietnamensis]|uniref:PDZ domain-containing protein n=1 Tax=Rossellomorea vietnamensis TaxID=218284 RepID=A0A5D4MAY3_9BACI|nr:PDZ domain-containing protein [Rossellomorea vietnamensis]TYR98862.1 PDZ domain-containing protein [Rossellomorea vietnamensis]